MNEIPELPFVLSFLQINDYLNCPRKTFYKHIKKITEVKSGAQSRGIDMHDHFKRYLKNNEPLPPEAEEYTRAVLPIKHTTGDKHVELALGAKGDGSPCGFFDPLCRLRGRVDVCVVNGPVAFIVDWKTGKPWEDPLELKLQALLLKIHHPDILTFMAGYYWLRENRMGKMYEVSDVEKTWNSVFRWATGIKAAIDTDTWIAEENPLCPWCPTTKVQCEFKKDKPR